MEKKIVDARGLACPLPVVNAKKALGEFKGEGMLSVLVDNEIAVQNLQKFASQKGLAAAGEKKAEKEYEVTIQVSRDAGTQANGNADAQTNADAGTQANGNAAAQMNADAGTQANGNAAAAEEISCRADARKNGLTVVLSADVMGGGEEKLGKTLMKAFVFALTKQDALPETIICYNSGAFLTCEGSQLLDDFKVLEAEGVNIMTCGTCLDFYGIKEKLAVGTVTNMYDIVETMEKSRSIIRP